MKLRAEGIDNATGKQKIVVELYDKFFRNAFPKMTERLGIVYTPVEVVDFIIHSVQHILQTEFGESLGSKGVHIIDPFTGTGIPLEAYDYVVNGKSAIDWVIERQGIKTDKDSGITNDANDWAIETMGNPRYSLEVLLRVITVSLETMKIVKSLPKLDI